MAKYHSADLGFLLVGPYDVKDVSNKLEDTFSDPAVDITPFGSSTAVMGKPGVKKYEITGHGGWYDDAATSINAAMVGMASGENVLMIAPQGNTMGKYATCAGGALKMGYTRGFAVGEFHTASMNLAVSGVVHEAVIVKPLAVTAAGDGSTESTYLDLTVAGIGAAGGTIYMSCTQLALTGSTNLIISLEDSADHITWGAHTAMTALTAIGAETKALAENEVLRYLAVKWVWTGLASTPTATFTVAVKVN